MRFKEGENVHVIVGNELLSGWYNGKEFGTGNSLVKVSKDKIIATKDCFIAKEKEAELVVVPKLVGDFLENHSKEDGHTLHDLLCDLLTSRDSLDENVYDWIMENNSENGELLARAWLDGYEVEKEPLYYVKLPYSSCCNATEKETNYAYIIVNKINNETQPTMSKPVSKYWKAELTEAQIKNMPAGDIYWQFAVLVEEVEGEEE
ncbi:DUF1642 domain-containing protein [Listeria monocytogenes]|uniref:DUF1642 domain-containing protein n=1 Tax=Listeria monocytogenes TaxID=1639 RepID=UPI00085BB086|nr:DUF1642 domain-containing protein [Listeria monocytogenes]MCZ94502.1 DUF1642 domain-containing protein [Listeria monocytogenes serotype 3c]EAC8152013.1 DUF1642 domain-containing protein [Listeria monocytogenes]EAD0387330.1 DUF1642 domain-containing protein [Listeria monocytogenes]EAD0450582.1 DUF1642 domain-containing protein [Listeria monocytogenes]EAD1564450.1 DUF1642 domain-containing protein [Listeria monocytogenes]